MLTIDTTIYVDKFEMSVDAVIEFELSCEPDSDGEYTYIPDFLDIYVSIPTRTEQVIPLENKVKDEILKNHMAEIDDILNDYALSVDNDTEYEYDFDESWDDFPFNNEEEYC